MAHLRPLITLVLMALLASPSIVAQGFQIDDRRIGRPDIHYLDPEFIDVHGQYKVLFTDSAYSTGKLWVADLDPVTGDFVSGHGTENVLDTGIAPLYETLVNGPEWGADRDGLAVFYTKSDPNHRRQIFRVELTTKPRITQVTDDTLDNIQVREADVSSIEGIHWRDSCSTYSLHFRSRKAPERGTPSCGVRKNTNKNDMPSPVDNNESADHGSASCHQADEIVADRQLACIDEPLVDSGIQRFAENAAYRRSGGIIDDQIHLIRLCELKADHCGLRCGIGKARESEIAAISVRFQLTGGCRSASWKQSEEAPHFPRCIEIPACFSDHGLGCILRIDS